MKVSELTGELLDYWVARAEGINTTLPKYGPILRADNIGGYYRPSRDWSVAGPITEREKISVRSVPDRVMGRIIVAVIERMLPGDFGVRWWNGSTPLEAAMRCYVASKFGEEVPDEGEQG